MDLYQIAKWLIQGNDKLIYLTRNNSLKKYYFINYVQMNNVM